MNILKGECRLMYRNGLKYCSYDKQKNKNEMRIGRRNTF